MGLHRGGQTPPAELPRGASCRRRHLSWEERVLRIAGVKAGLCRKGDNAQSSWVLGGLTTSRSRSDQVQPGRRGDPVHCREGL